MSDKPRQEKLIPPGAFDTGATARTAEPTSIVPTKGGGEIGELLRAAIDKDVTVESMEKLVNLYERMEDRKSKAAFNEAFAAFKAECPVIDKNKTATIVGRGGSRHTIKWASKDHICAIAEPVLNRHGFAFGWDSIVEGPLLRTICSLYHRMGHSRTGSFSCPVESSAGMSEQQKYAAATEFAERKSLTAVLGLSTTDEDTDTALLETIGPEQIADIEALLSEVEPHTPNCRARFLKYCAVKDVESITVSGHTAAVKALEKMRGAL